MIGLQALTSLLAVNFRRQTVATMNHATEMFFTVTLAPARQVSKLAGALVVAAVGLSSFDGTEMVQDGGGLFMRPWRGIAGALLGSMPVVVFTFFRSSLVACVGKGCGM